MVSLKAENGVWSLLGINERLKWRALASHVGALDVGDFLNLVLISPSLHETVRPIVGTAFCDAVDWEPVFDDAAAPCDGLDDLDDDLLGLPPSLYNPIARRSEASVREAWPDEAGGSTP